MSSYEALAARYDALTADVDHAAWADYLEKHFARCGQPIHTVLDLACGTGTMTCLLAERGYETIGVDRSADMLSVAAEKGRQVSGIPPLFLQQSMQELDLYGTVDACVCCLDSVNYVTRPAELLRAFRRVCLFLVPGGLYRRPAARRTEAAPPQARGAAYLFYCAKGTIIRLWMRSYA